MIVKVMAQKQNPQSWRYYGEANEVQSYENIPLPDELIDGPDYADVLFMANDGTTPEFYNLVTFATGERCYNIYTDMPVFLMNNNGETVDKLA